MNRIHISHPAFDIEDQIIKAGNVPAPVELKTWQARIDNIAGKTVEGRSRLRIVWGQSQEATLWCLGRMRHKYPFWRYEADGEIHDIGTPRFYVEELHDIPELRRNNSWESARYRWEGLEQLDVLGPMPEEGFYTSVFLIAHHDEACCNGLGHVRNELCLGAYRPPTDADLTRIRRMKQRRDAASPTENRPSEDLILKWNKEAGEKRDNQFREKLHERVKDWIAVHGHRITDSMNPKIVKHGKYNHMPLKTFEGDSLKETFNDRTSDSDRSATA